MTGPEEGVLEDWAELGVGLPCDCAPDAPWGVSLEELTCWLGPAPGVFVVLSSSIASQTRPRGRWGLEDERSIRRLRQVDGAGEGLGLGGSAMASTGGTQPDMLRRDGGGCRVRELELELFATARARAVGVGGVCFGSAASDVARVAAEEVEREGSRSNPQELEQLGGSDRVVVAEVVRIASGG